MSAPEALVVHLPGDVDAAVWTVATESDPGPQVPEIRDDLDPDDVTPGLLGFLVIFAAVLACIPLFLSMTGKLRGVRHRAEREAAEEAAAAADGPGPGADPAASAEPPAGTGATPSPERP